MLTFSGFTLQQLKASASHHSIQGLPARFLQQIGYLDQEFVHIHVIQMDIPFTAAGQFRIIVDKIRIFGIL